MIARRFPNRFLALTTVAASALCASSALAHINLTEPTPRTTADQQKINPCGGVERGEPSEFEAGSTISVKWNDGISHPGWYVISFDPTGDDFDSDGDGTGDFPAQSTDAVGMYSNGDGSLVLADDLDLVEFDGNRTPGEHTAEITFPNEPCEECTLQLIQVMDDTGHAPSAQRPSGHIYFRCADIRLVGGGDVPPDDGAGGAGDAPDAGPASSMDPVGSGAVPPVMSTPDAPDPDPSTPPGMPTMMMPPAMMPTATAMPTQEPIVPPAMTMMPTATMTMTPPAPTPTMTATEAAPTAPVATPAPTTSTAATTTDDGDDAGGCAVHSGNASETSASGWTLLAAALAFAARKRAASR